MPGHTFLHDKHVMDNAWASERYSPQHLHQYYKSNPLNEGEHAVELDWKVKGLCYNITAVAFCQGGE